jgi:hypothetical protein
MIGKVNLQVRKIVLSIFCVFLICIVGIGSFYIVDILNYIYPKSDNIRINPYIDFNPESRAYCDTYHILVNLRWSARSGIENGNGIQAFYSELLAKKFGHVQDLDNQYSYLITNHWLPLSGSKYFFIDIKKVFFDARVMDYSSMFYMYGIETRVYIGVFPKIENLCPDKS